MIPRSRRHLRGLQSRASPRPGLLAFLKPSFHKIHMHNVQPLYTFIILPTYIPTHTPFPSPFLPTYLPAYLLPTLPTYLPAHSSNLPPTDPHLLIFACLLACLFAYFSTPGKYAWQSVTICVVPSCHKYKSLVSVNKRCRFAVSATEHAHAHPHIHAPIPSLIGIGSGLGVGTPELRAELDERLSRARRMWFAKTDSVSSGSASSCEYDEPSTLSMPSLKHLYLGLLVSPRGSTRFEVS